MRPRHDLRFARNAGANDERQDKNARPVRARMKRLCRSAYLYRSKTFDGYEMAKRDNTDCKQIAVQESLQIREPRLLVAVSVGYAACAA